MIGSTYISTSPCHILFNFYVSHFFILDQCFDSIKLQTLLLPILLSMILPMGANMIASILYFFDLEFFDCI